MMQRDFTFLLSMKKAHAVMSLDIKQSLTFNVIKINMLVNLVNKFILITFLKGF